MTPTTMNEIIQAVQRARKKHPHFADNRFTWEYANIHENADLLEEKSEKPILLEDKNEQN